MPLDRETVLGGARADRVIAAGLRLYRLGFQPLSADEAYTFAFTERGFTGMLSLFREEPNGLLYQLVTYPVMQLTSSDAGLRLPAAVAGILAVPALYWAGSRLTNRVTALVGAALLAVLPIAVQQSQTARPYAVLLLTSAVAVGCLDRALTGRRAWWIGYIAAVVLSMYTNALAVYFIVPPHVILVVQHGTVALRRWLVALLGCVLAAVPLGVLLADDAAQRNALYWLDPPGLRDLAAIQASLVGGKREGVVIVIVIAAAATLALSRGSLRRRARTALDDPLTFVGAWALWPTAFAFVASQYTPILSIRYLIPAVPGACLLVAACVVRLPRPAAVAALLALLLVPVPALVERSRSVTLGDWRAAVAEVDRLRRPGEPLLLDTAEGIGPAGRYLASLRSPDGLVIVSEWHDARLPAGVTLLQDPGGYSDTAYGPPTPALVRRLAAQTGRLLIVFSYVSGNKQGDVLHDAGVGWARRTLQRDDDSIRPRQCRRHRRGNRDHHRRDHPLPRVTDIHR